MTGIETLIAFAGAFLIVATWRFLYRFVPWAYGAALTGILWGDEAHEEPAPFWTIVVRLLVPFAFGVLGAMIRPGMATLALLIMGGLGGLLVCWPNILEPHRIPPALWSKTPAVYVVYGIFASLCGLSALVGGRLSGYVVGNRMEELSTFGVSVLASATLALLLWIVQVAWATRDVHGDMWRYDR